MQDLINIKDDVGKYADKVLGLAKELLKKYDKKESKKEPTNNGLSNYQQIKEKVEGLEKIVKDL